MQSELLALKVEGASGLQALLDTAKRCDVLLVPWELLRNRCGTPVGEGPTYEQLRDVLRHHAVVGVMPPGGWEVIVYSPLPITPAVFAAWANDQGYPESVARA